MLEPTKEEYDLADEHTAALNDHCTCEVCKKVWGYIASITPSWEELMKMAENSGPPPELLDEEESNPFD